MLVDSEALPLLVLDRTYNLTDTRWAHRTAQVAGYRCKILGGISHLMLVNIAFVCLVRIVSGADVGRGECLLLLVGTTAPSSQAGKRHCQR